MKLEQEISQPKFKNEYVKAAINIIYTKHWVMAFHSHLLKQEDVTSQQYNILRILRGQYPKPASVKLIRERMLDRMSDASRIVEKLRLKGLVERKSSEVDRRNVDVTITEKGIELLDRINNLDDLMAGHLANLNESEIRQLNDLLDKLRG